MRRAAHVLQAIQAEIVRRQADVEDDSLNAITIVVKLDRQTGLPGAILWRPEFERKVARVNPPNVS